MTLEEKYNQVYYPLMDDFVKKLLERKVSDYQGIPHPFVPIWGKNYEKAFKKIAIVGKETRRWGMDLQEFVERYRQSQYLFEQDRYEFQNLEFRDWGTKGPGSFWGFWMRVLANVYGVENWLELKKGKRNYLLDDFIWGNTHAIETNKSETIKTLLKNKLAPGYTFAYNTAEMILNKIDYLEMVFAPDVVIVTDAEYEGYLGKGWVCEKKVGDKVNVLKRGDLIVFQCNHPNNMRFQKGGAKEYARILRDLLCEYGFFFSLQGMRNKFISADAKETLVERIKKVGDKYKAIEVVALMLRKYGCIMSARDLSDLLNESGYRTNRGRPFTGNCRGPYKLIRAAYKRAGVMDMDIADAIACSFTRANGSYAYK